MEKENRQAGLDFLKHQHFLITGKLEELKKRHAAEFEAAKEAAEIDIGNIIKTAVIFLIAFSIFDKLYNKHKIYKPPGAKINAFARFVYSKRTYERIFMQLVVDMREEHAEALQSGSPQLARWIAIRGWCAMVMTMITHGFASCGKAFIKIWRMTP